jgi:hypothetical protein
MGGEMGDSRRGEKGHIFWGGILPWGGAKTNERTKDKIGGDIWAREGISCLFGGDPEKMGWPVTRSLKGARGNNKKRTSPQVKVVRKV